MDILQAIILGVVQGVTEFVPISSSGHLVLVPWLLGWADPGLTWDLMAHWGTLLAVVLYYRQDLWAITVAFLRGLLQRQPFASFEARLGWFLILATIPAVVIGGLFKDPLEQLFEIPQWVAVELIITGTLLWFSERLGHRNRTLESQNWRDALAIGFAQVLAIPPGISRSGTTIAAGLALGLDRPAAARFSFLMSVPIILGAGLLQLSDAVEVGITSNDVTFMAIGFVTAFISGYACIALLIRYLATHSVRIFAIYCWIFGAACLAISLTR